MEEKGYPDVIMMLLHQALEKYIKGHLIMQGWKLKKIHDLETLFTEAGKHDKIFAKHLDLGRILTAYYYENRYPPGPIPGINKKKIRTIYSTTLKIIKLFIKKHS